MKKLTNSVLVVVMSSSMALISAQKKVADTTAKTKDIGEVVITGALGLKKKADAQTSSQQVVTASELNQASSPNAVSALTGKVSGVQITQTNSSVTGDFSIVIRGQRTITGSNEALVVIDNVISTAAVLQQLPPEVIESVNIIKGGSGAALYGSQGINGVVVVTTKRGTKSKRLSVSLTSAVDFESVGMMPTRQTMYGQGWSGGKVNVENGAWGWSFNDPKYAGTIQPYGIPLYDYNKNGVIDFNPNDSAPAGDEAASIMSPFKSFGNDEIRKFFKTGSLYQNTLSINAGDGDGYIMLTLNNVNRDFMIQDDILRRTSAMLKGGMKVGKWRFEGIVNYNHQKTSTTTQDIYYQLLQSATDIPITRWRDYKDNAYAWNVYYQNPYWNIKHLRYNNLSNYFNAIASAQYDVDSHISLMYRGNVQYTNTESNSHNDGWSSSMIDATAITSSYYKYNTTLANYYGDLMANFNYDLTDDLNMMLNVGHNYQEWRTNNMSAGGTGIQIPGIYQVWNLSNPAQPYSLNNKSFFRNQHALFANLDLNYKSFLFLNASARYELTSVLPKNSNGYFYPSVGVSFVPTKAFNFLKDNSVLNYLKVALNYSRIGQSSAISTYSIYDRPSLGSGYPYGTGPLSFVINQSPTDQNIRPEFTTKKEVNLSFSLFKDRISFDGAYYQEDTDDLITNATTSNTTGLTQRLFNIGKLKGKGYELNLNLVPIKSNDFKWDLGLSMSHQKTIITKLTDDAKSVRLAGNSFLGLYADEGEELTIIKGIAYQRDPQGRIIVDSNTGLPQVTSTQEKFGRTTPKYIFGLTTNISFKGFRLSAVMDYRTGHKFYSGTLQGFTFNGLNIASAVDRSQPYIVPNSSYKDGSGNYVSNTSIPIYNNSNGKTNPQAALENYFGGASYNTVSDNYVLDATAFKVREIALSYTFPKSALGTTGINALTVGVHARNPFQKYSKENKGYNDPETAFDPRYRGLANAGQYPEYRTYGANITITF
ncbi:SusC/RagA family TonB-linked outer membrane protein [Elizabethkingia anophelis]|uniref:SusC/RagA family TonB-linked outer membrane protein n=1 Tax=Elizabethkingia anophelis TaxID=1117645 RepID=UPI000667AB59|nr:SusC/RagA family TonB-linked outer membrane protein [Elizabethkingia anophelis]AQW90117.1 SusC/RagA family TonB-linked outer membrane protein [Elizabethkingia anophelis]KUY23719.1 SusC/RagA family TonB-linked outer membrane protein [Elizabethkingia anophelis]MCT3719866.1 SusC/RagA family TonB-linked outer membrane protein [Elizabethkingia anophelis]MCT3723376.1 SusC/RagA family TonB-linked outer membrane protein [Elizabethkingia anophelis]MCT3728330.1 SusC/RagA family TonB-linked outer memb